MKEPDIPKDEEARLATLRSLNILDTQSEERFDRLTRIAKRMFNVPIALVSLVDENRQWFKSSVGLNVDETPRNISFCGHTILDDKVFIIHNAADDPRFIDNPLVLSEPNIHFYAGCPLVVNGYKLGTLCIIDKVSRNFDKEDIEALEDLASMAEQELAAVELATKDELTGILNRRGFITLSQHILNLCIRQSHSIVLVFFDLDKFKLINDKFGHIEGDVALIAFSELMNSTLRESDLFARLGGDEFVTLHSSTSKEQTEIIIERFNNSLKKYNKEIDSGYDILFSYGIVEFNSEKHTCIEELLANGDSLMYSLKNKKYNKR